jgi:hypothetical protein
VKFFKESTELSSLTAHKGWGKTERKGMTFLFKKIRMSGFTLVELMVGLACASMVFLAAGVVFFRGTELSAYFFRNASVMEQVSDGITQLSAFMPQIIHIRTCNCSAAGASSGASCTWTSATEWNDPVLDYGIPSPVTLLDADYESGFGGAGIGAAQYLTADQTLTSYYAGLGCEAAHPGGITSRGCRKRLRLIYTPPTAVSGSTPSTPGELRLDLNDTSWSGTTTSLRIGNIQANTARSSRVGITKLSCGFATPNAGQIGTDFVINMRMKVKSSGVEDVTNAFYESWYPGGTNYSKGFVRESKLRFSFLNLSPRGMYQWRIASVKGCKIAGQAATSREECCSMALNAAGNACVAGCIQSTQVATNNSQCCSEKIVGGVCI